MPATIDRLWRTRLKGASGFFPHQLVINTVTGPFLDREFAIRRKSGGDLDKWAPKAAFFVGMNTPGMVTEVAECTNERDGKDRLHPDYLDDLRCRLRLDSPPIVQAADETYSLHDTQGAFVSFLNLASVDALSDYMGVPIDPRRFRMNCWMTGLEPFEELSWVDTYPGTRVMEVGACQFRIDDACERCKAIEASPQRGAYDLDVQKKLSEMMATIGYKSPKRGVPCVMGILAQPLSDGIIRCGDNIRLVT